MAAPFQNRIVLPREIFKWPVAYSLQGMVLECTCGCPHCIMQNTHGMIMLVMNLGDSHEVVLWESKN